MAPILIDNRDLPKLAFVSVLTIVVAFAGGFIFGYQQATMGYDHEKNSVSESSQLSAQKEISNNEVKQVSDTASASEKSDADRVEPVKESTTVRLPAASVVKAAKDKSDTAVKEKSEKKKIVADNEIRKDKKTVALSGALPEIQTGIQTNTQTKANDTEAGNDKIKYSVQVAVYGRLDNAETMMKKLQAKGLDAYVSDYLNKKNKVWFNVRFGYFKDKKSANQALKEYTDAHKGDGYLVNYSANNIVDIAQRKSADKESRKEATEAKVETIDRADIVQADIELKQVTTTDVSSDDASQAKKAEPSKAGIPDELEEAQANIPAIN